MSKAVIRQTGEDIKKPHG